VTPLLSYQDFQRLQRRRERWERFVAYLCLLGTVFVLSLIEAAWEFGP
jgi:hypothetical protein